MRSTQNTITDNRFISNGGRGLWEYECSGNVLLRNEIILP
jgi:parallel beta-helix repeat protein